LTGIQLSGLASGLDTQSIITQLMSIEQQPRDRVARQQVVVQTRQAGLQQVDSSLTNLKLAAGDLRSALLWVPTQQVTSTNDSVVSAQLTSGAAPGGYTVNVSTLASADSRTYDWNAGGGDLTIDYKADGSSQSKTFDLTGKSIDDAVAEINGDNASPVWAVNVNGKLSLSRRETGDHDTWGFEATGAALGAQISARDGTDATYTVSGDSTTYSSHNGTATDGLPGVQLTLKGVGTATVNVTTPQVDSSAVADKIKAFVTAYNSSVDLVRSKLNEKPVVDPQTDDDAAVGTLYGDQTLSAVLSQMRQTISEAGLDKLGVTVPGTGSGTSDDALAGKLTFDESTFDEAWAANPAGVQAQLGSPNVSGFAQKFEAVIDPVTRSGDGILDQRVNDANSELADIKDSLAEWDVRLQAKQDYLQAQFTALETAMSQSQAQSADLSGQIAGLLGSS
jgi:flagellar hook-associated protein 2